MSKLSNRFYAKTIWSEILFYWILIEINEEREGVIEILFGQTLQNIRTTEHEGIRGEYNSVETATGNSYNNCRYSTQ